MGGPLRDLHRITTRVNGIKELQRPPTIHAAPCLKLIITYLMNFDAHLPYIHNGQLVKTLVSLDTGVMEPDRGVQLKKGNCFPRPSLPPPQKAGTKDLPRVRLPRFRQLILAGSEGYPRQGYRA